ncbi:type II secretion system protein J [Thermodesulfobacteriota bacterium]
MIHPYKNAGFTLFEVLVSIVLLGIIMIGLQQVLGSALSGYEVTKGKQDLLITARFAVDRMVRFAEESDVIANPVSDTAEETLKVSERLLDTYNNTTRAYDIDGDDVLDADNDANDLINDDTTNDPAEYVTFNLDKTDANNWKLKETLPDYSSASLVDTTAAKIICENVVAFECKLLDTDLVEIRLALEKDNSAVDLKTRVRARFVVP